MLGELPEGVYYIADLIGCEVFDEEKALDDQTFCALLERIGITAGTNEKLGYVGEGKGITVNAYALLKK